MFAVLSIATNIQGIYRGAHDYVFDELVAGEHEEGVEAVVKLHVFLFGLPCVAKKYKVTQGINQSQPKSGVFRVFVGRPTNSSKSFSKYLVLSRRSAENLLSTFRSYAHWKQRHSKPINQVTKSSLRVDTAPHSQLDQQSDTKRHKRHTFRSDPRFQLEISPRSSFSMSTSETAIVAAS